MKTCELPFPFLSLRTVNIVTHIYDISAVLPHVLIAKDRQTHDLRFQVIHHFLYVKFPRTFPVTISYYVKKILITSAASFFHLLS